ncbi:leucyl aminopeptidase family protein [Shewanella sp. JM162201]|uniref:Leucyl aminopeptidase family protein n=1 Tax=Shewanella jiangmenensis TaxID=2837387 RepID=A0ABS5V2N0_9GAMM|nr:leucyl aminopeptidase family protein [Shewanella jiangmenensis]MBT1444702.1 leucyl aminopeptidase family protein [Shewanella jiangmenensis]
MFQAKFVVEKNEDGIFEGEGFDALLVLTPSLDAVTLDEVRLLAAHAGSIDKRVGRQPTLLLAPGLAGGRLILAPINTAYGDYDDVRSVAQAARAAIAIARDAGATRPLLALFGRDDTNDAMLAAALGCGQELWQALEAREQGAAPCSIETIGLFGADEALATLARALESGRNLARDLCGTEPERMSAPAFADYCVAAFEGSGIQTRVIEGRDELERDYPLLCAVGRASFKVARHQPRVVKLDYVGEGEIERTFLFAGKGVVYDTGGADIKVGGAMAGMSRDKGGAAAVAGLMKTLSILKPRGIRVIAELGLVRNSLGADAFVTDEIIASHAGVRVRIGNTDAEGRLVLADLLSHLRQKAVNAVNPALFSVATLTGHVVRAYGGYPAAVTNAAAASLGLGATLAELGDRVGEPIEVSRLRREDFDKIRESSGAAAILSSNNAPSSVTARGHQFPAAFLIKASGLDAHERSSQQPLPYVHLDIAGSATEGDPLYGKPTASPVTLLCHYLTK